MSNAAYKRLLIVFTLGFSSGLPLSLITSLLQAWFANMHFSVLKTGAMSLLSFPYVLQFIWGPFVDYYKISFFGRRRSWIGLMQIFLCIGFYIIALCSISTSFIIWVSLVLFLSVCSSIQDVAINAHRIEYLPQKEQPLGASLAITAYRIALLISGGVAFFLAEKNGFPWVYRHISLLLVFGLLATYFSKEPKIINSTENNSSSLIIAFKNSIKTFLLQKNCLILISFIISYKLGEAFTTTTSGIIMPFLIYGQGLSLTKIAYVTNTLGVGGLIIGGFLTGFVLKKIDLYKSLWIFGFLQAITNLIFVFLSIINPESNQSMFLFILAIFSDNLVAGMGSMALVILLMRSVDKQFTATHYSLFIAISSLPRIFSGIIGAGLYNLFDWTGLYIISVFLALGFIPFLYRLQKLHQN